MSEGFNDKLKVVVNQDEVDKLLKKYKKIKKYIKSSMYAVKVMTGKETYVSQLIKEAEDNG
jgi:hypoxanthine-guanine phosphoribosyltransferase